MSATLASRLLEGDRHDEASDVYDRLNADGEGFEPDEEIADWLIVVRGTNMDEVCVYRDGDDAILVGDAGGLWAVRVSA